MGKINPAVPIIAQTAYASETDRKKSVEAGCNDYIVKPIDRNELLKIIYRVLG
jgi:CheY-like chemotaxis protein